MAPPGGIGEMRHTCSGASPPAVPASLVQPRPRGRSRATSSTSVHVLRARGRVAAVSGIFADDLYQQWSAYHAYVARGRPPHGQGAVPLPGDDHHRALAALSRRVRLRRALPRGGCELCPPRPLEVGYCQQFAGTMALMSPLPRSPAPVAVSQRAGTWSNGTWTVTDHDAHARLEPGSPVTAG